MADEDDYHNSGNLDEAPSGPEYDEEALRKREEFLQRLHNMSEADIARDARRAMLEDLYEKVVSGTAMPQDHANLRQLLKDNGMIMGDPTQGAGGDSNPKAAKEPLPLPSFERPEYDP